jgi:predicted dehydrogenase
MAQLAHLPSFAAVAEAEIVALATHRPEVGAALAGRYGIPQIYFDYRDLIANPNLDAVVCIQPYHQHFALGQAVLASGKALFTEKPMVTRYDHGRQLVELAERQGVVYGVGFMKRFDPGVQLAREQLAVIIGSGELGRLRLVEAHCYLGDWLQGSGTPVTDASVPVYAPIERHYPNHVGAALAPAFDYLLEVYCHNLNLVRYLLPDEQLVCLGAVMADPQTWALTLASGDVLVSLQGAQSAAHHWDETTSFIFERGQVTVRTPAPMQRQAVAALTVYAHGGGGAVSVERRLHPAEIEWAFARQARAFVAAVRGETPYAAPGRDSLRDLALIEQIFRIAQRLAQPTRS